MAACAEPDGGEPMAPDAACAEASLFEARVSFGDLFSAYKSWSSPVLHLANVLMTQGSALTWGERELIAGYVSTLQGCSLCTVVHTKAANSLGVDTAVVHQLIEDIDQAAVDPKLRPLFKYVKKLVVSPSALSENDVVAVRSAGWSKRALFEAVAITGYFTMMNKIEFGMLFKAGWDEDSLREVHSGMGAHLANAGYTGMADICGVPRLTCSPDTRPPLLPEAPPSLSSAGLRTGEGWPAETRLHGRPLCTGMTVLLQGLNSQHNGKTASLLEYVPHAGNWRAELSNAMVIRVDPTNCVALVPSQRPDAATQPMAPAASSPQPPVAARVPPVAPQQHRQPHQPQGVVRAVPAAAVQHAGSALLQLPAARSVPPTPDESPHLAPAVPLDGLCGAPSVTPPPQLPSALPTVPSRTSPSGSDSGLRGAATAPGVSTSISAPSPAPAIAVDKQQLVIDALQRACRIGSEANQQPWSYVLVRDMQLRRRIRQVAEEAEKTNVLGGRLNSQWIEDLRAAGQTDACLWQRPALEHAPFCIALLRHVWRPRGRKLPIYFPEQVAALSCGYFLARLEASGLPAEVIRIRFGEQDPPRSSSGPSGVSAHTQLRDLLGRPANEKLMLLVVCGHQVPPLPSSKPFEEMVAVR
eukprot:TRINITY_DN27531_c0_g1_i1.p1 TRINITY_DN27531_c0_g1~~TRINITY_DN27531_c0_g1_i1.p1  ORF type:complete len:679 (+),score=171.86 TRINITY_DN27531_c0_g1_i1:118-2037(+)